jgi:hypothetical protein
MHIRFNDDIMFVPESYLIRREGAEALARIAPGIRAVNRFIESAEITGHTAPAPPGVAFETWNRVNPWQLSSNRATAVTMFLDRGNDEQRLPGLRMVDSDKFQSIGHGPYQPHYDPTDLEANRGNRRVEIILTRNEYAPDDTASMLDMLQYDYMFPILTDGPLGGRQVSPDFGDRNKQILNRIQERYGMGNEIFEPQPPAPTDGRRFDFTIPAIP